MIPASLRYQLPKKAIKGNCPSCGSKRRKTLSRYIDSRTGEPIPEIYGRCDRESNCSYHLSPYHKKATGFSYAEEMYEQWQVEKSMSSQAQSHWTSQRHQQRRPITTIDVQRLASAATEIYTIPNEVFVSSMSHYDQNLFAVLLRSHFGLSVANDLLQRFRIGTSSYWPGASVFWILDEQQRVRSGQVVLFAKDWHKAKYTDREGNVKPCISSVSHGLLSRCRKAGKNLPTWLRDYHDNAPRWPCLFGLSQLAIMPQAKPAAVVEAPKTAIVCTPYFPQFVWFAVGALSYVNAERLAPLRDRPIVLFPDLSKDGGAFARWSRIADKLRTEGFNVTVSDFLEKRITAEHQREAGLDLADWLLEEWSGYPPDWST